MLYKKKQNLLNSHILHLTFSLIGTIDSGKESSVIPNKKAFQDLLCDLEVWPYDLLSFKLGIFYILLCMVMRVELLIMLFLQVWHHAPFDLQRSLYEHFFELLTDSR